MVVIRMARGGAKNRPFYNIVVADSRMPRDGRFIERIGFYNPKAAEHEPKFRHRARSRRPLGRPGRAALGRREEADQAWQSRSHRQAGSPRQVSGCPSPARRERIGPGGDGAPRRRLRRAGLGQGEDLHRVGPTGLARASRAGGCTRATAGARCALEDFEVHSKGPVAKLAGCDDRDAAERAARAARWPSPRAALGEARDGAIYWVDLVGLEVVDCDGAGARPGRGILRDRRDRACWWCGAGERERMIPFVPDYVKAVDRDARAHHGGLEGGLRRVMRFDVVTIFPEMFDALAGPRHHAPRAGREGVRAEGVGPAGFRRATAYRTVDDRPYGGGPGMVMLAEPLAGVHRGGEGAAAGGRRGERRRWC